MSTSDTLAQWLSDGAVGGVEAAEALARLRSTMFAKREVRPSLGRYGQLEPLGRGGMGVVYRAWDERLERPVAVKLLRLEHKTDRQRLIREARAMAQLSDDNVVEVFDVGEHEGEAFVAMELVEGSDAAQWLRERSRTAAEVLAVFAGAGAGLAAAHARGIVHRDFKPSNVLVGDDGRVRVADFGLAAAVSRAEPETVASRGPSDSLTAPRGGVGTPRYMAPEQREGGLVDHRADQWAFAASLWESLFATPDQRPERPLDPPATDAVSPAVVAALRRATLPEPGARFDSMDGLLAALTGRGRRRRRTLAVALAATVGVAGTVAWAQSSASTGCDPVALLQPTWNADRSREVASALRSGGGELAARAWVPARQRLDAWGVAWTEAYAAQCVAVAPDAERDLGFACLRGQLAQLDDFVGELATADTERISGLGSEVARLPRPASCAEVATRRTLYDGVDPAALEEHLSRIASIRSRAMAGQYAEALSESEAALAAVEHPQLVAEAQLQVGLNRERTGDDQGAIEPLEAAFDHGSQFEDPALAAEAAVGRLNAAAANTEHDAVDRWAGHALSWADRAGNPERTLAVQAGVSHANSLIARGEYERADAVLQGAWSACNRDAAHPRAHRVLNQMGLLAIERGEYREAADLFARSHESLVRIVGRDSPLLADGLTNAGNAHFYLGDHAAATEAYEKTYEIRKAVYGDNHPKTALSLMNMGVGAQSAGGLDRAASLTKKAVAIYRATLGDGHPDTALALSNLGVLFHRMGDEVASEAAHRESLEIYEGVFAGDHPRVIRQLSMLASSTLELGDVERALEMFERTLTMSKKSNGPRHPAVASILQSIAIAHERSGNYETSRRYGLEALAIYEEALGPDHPTLVRVLGSLAHVAIELEQWETVVAEAGRARDLKSRNPVDRGMAALRLAKGLVEIDLSTDVSALFAEAEGEFIAAGPPGESRLAELKAFRKALAATRGSR